MNMSEALKTVFFGMIFFFLGMQVISCTEKVGYMKYVLRVHGPIQECSNIILSPPTIEEDDNVITF